MYFEPFSIQDASSLVPNKVSPEKKKEQLRHTIKNLQEKIKNLQQQSKARQQELQRNVTLAKRQLKTTKQRTKRLENKISSMENVIQSLKNKALVSSNCIEFLKQNFNGVPLELFKRKIQLNGKSGKGFKYPLKLKAFALTLQFYSTKAYEFVRRSFDLNLPHQTQIRKWYSRVPAEPGFTEPSFKALAAKVFIFKYLISN